MPSSNGQITVANGLGISGSISGQELKNRLADAQSVPPYINAVSGLLDPSTQYSSYTFQGFSVTNAQGQTVRVPTMQFVNYTQQQLETLNLVHAIIKFQVMQGGALPSVIGEVFGYASTQGETLLSISTGTSGSLTKALPSGAGGQTTSDKGRTPDGDIETIVKTNDLLSLYSGKGVTVALIDRIFHEFSHDTATHKVFQKNAGVLGNLDVYPPGSFLQADRTYQGGKGLTTFIKDFVAQNSSITVDGKAYDLSSLSFSDANIKDYYDGSTQVTGLITTAAERYENQRVVSVLNLLKTYKSSVEAGKGIPIIEGNSAPEALTAADLALLETKGYIKWNPQGNSTDRGSLENYDISKPDALLVDYNKDGIKNTGITKDKNGNIIVDATHISDWDNFSSALKLGISAAIDIDGGQLGLALGSVLGRRLSGNDPFKSVLLSGTLSTVLGAVGEFLDEKIFKGTSTANILGHGIDGFAGSLVSNIANAGAGALSSYLTAELFQALGLHGTAGELGQTVAGSYLSAILINLPGIASNTTTISQAVGNVNLANVVGSYLGSKLADQVVSFNSVGGQIGSAVGAIYGSFAATATLATLGTATGVAAAGASIGSAALAFAAANPILAVAVVVVVVFIDKILGGVIGSLFGGTPRSGADVEWDESSRRFTVDNVWSKKGGSKDAARNIAGAVADTYNNVLSAIGGELMHGESVQGGNYGMRGKDFVYRPVSSDTKESITAKFNGKDAAGKLIAHGSYLGLSDIAFQIAGGDVMAKRALLATLAAAGGNPNSNAPGAAGAFDVTTLLGNISTAKDYGGYLKNTTAINALIAADATSAFAAGPGAFRRLAPVASRTPRQRALTRCRMGVWRRGIRQTARRPCINNPRAALRSRGIFEYHTRTGALWRQGLMLSVWAGVCDSRKAA